jgi:hypothetical protein
MFNIHKDYKILKPIRRWLANKAFIRLILDCNKLNSDDLFLLGIVVISQFNRNSPEYKYSIEIHKVNK